MKVLPSVAYPVLNQGVAEIERLESRKGCELGVETMSNLTSPMRCGGSIPTRVKADGSSNVPSNLIGGRPSTEIRTRASFPQHAFGDLPVRRGTRSESHTSSLSGKRRHLQLADVETAAVRQEKHVLDRRGPKIFEDKAARFALPSEDLPILAEHAHFVTSGVLLAHTTPKCHQDIGTVSPGPRWPPYAFPIPCRPRNADHSYSGGTVENCQTLPAADHDAQKKWRTPRPDGQPPGTRTPQAAHREPERE